jgi:hypothetical protein
LPGGASGLPRGFDAGTQTWTREPEAWRSIAIAKFEFELPIDRLSALVRRRSGLSARPEIAFPTSRLPASRAPRAFPFATSGIWPSLGRLPVIRAAFAQLPKHRNNAQPPAVQSSGSRNQVSDGHSTSRPPGHLHRQTEKRSTAESLASETEPAYFQAVVYFQTLGFFTKGGRALQCSCPGTVLPKYFCGDRGGGLKAGGPCRLAVFHFLRGTRPGVESHRQGWLRHRNLVVSPCRDTCSSGPRLGPRIPPSIRWQPAGHAACTRLPCSVPLTCDHPALSPTALRNCPSPCAFPSRLVMSNLEVCQLPATYIKQPQPSLLPRCPTTVSSSDRETADRIIIRAPS